MPQTIRSVVAEVRAESTDVLIQRVRNLNAAGLGQRPPFDGLQKRVPSLHFMSVSVFRDSAYDPFLILEANFDGPPGPFWAELEAEIGTELRDALRCCKPPRGPLTDLFRAVIRADAAMPVAPLLEALTVAPAAAHQGNRGYDRDRIAREAALFQDVEEWLAVGTRAVGQGPTTLHAALRAAMLPRHSWLARPLPAPIDAAEMRADHVRLAAIAVAILAGLLAPWLLLAQALSVTVAVVLALIVAGVSLRRLGATTPGTSDRPSVNAALLGLGALVLVAWFDRHWLWLIVAALLGGIATLLAVAASLRRAEGLDPSQDMPAQNPALIRALESSEDRIAQNHMGSIVHVKPGLLRAVLIRIGLHGLHAILRVKARDGYLGDMRTIHFAHWALIGNQQRLLFFSNFDGTWESYLDDFIEKAHAGLTLAWTNAVGFPPTRFLVLDGATNGTRFKQWARHSMAEHLLWYSAYPDLTVNQIARNARIAGGLAKAAPSAEEAATWIRDL